MMMLEQFIKSEAAFDPHDIKAMEMALEDVCKALKVPEGTKAARQTIVYAIIGLVVVALAQIIVHFVLNNVNTGTS